jgi:hypothetical protein
MTYEEPTLESWILECAEGEAVEAVVLGDMGWGGYKSSEVPDYENQPKGKVLSWEEALPWIGYKFNDSYGAPGCNCVAAWTKSWVISVYQYDGSTGPFRIPRNPVDFMPEMPGG